MHGGPAVIFEPGGVWEYLKALRLHERKVAAVKMTQ